MILEVGKAYKDTHRCQNNLQIYVCGTSTTSLNKKIFIIEQGLNFNYHNRITYDAIFIDSDSGKNWKEIYKEKYILDNYVLGESHKKKLEDILKRKIILDNIDYEIRRR